MASNIVAVFALVALATLAVMAPVDAKSDRLFRLALGATEDARCNNTANSCASCTSRLKCANIMGTWVKVTESACPTRTPYCQQGTCQAQLPDDATCSTDPLPVAAFDCPNDGYWPDMTSCTRYFFCVGGTAYAMDCSAFANTVYDQRTTRCVPRSRSQCFTLRCSDPNPDRPVVYTPYTPAPWIYAVCTSRNASLALVGACDVGKAMNPDTSQCEDACNAEGRFKNTNVPADTVSYYECADLGGGKLSKPIPNKCPAPSTFDATTERCVIAAVP